MSIHRRRTGEGNVRFVVRWREGGRGGTNRQATFDSHRDARLFDGSIRRAQQLGQLASEVRGSNQLVSEFVDEWWAKYAIVHLRRGTLSTYVYVLDRWILPYLGSHRLRDVSRETIDGYVAAISAAGANPPTVNRTLGVLQGILRRAVEWRRIPANPVVGVPRLRHVRAQTIDARPPETVEAIRRVLGRDDAAIVSLAAYEGLRPGEIFALEFRDFLNDRGRPRDRITVERALSADQLSVTKSGRAREPELFGPVGRELAELYLARGRPALRSLAFPDARGGYHRRQNWRQRVWQPALAAAGVAYFRPYDLRHTCATLLVYAGWTVNEVAEHLGHADPGFTARTYQHVFRDARKRRGVTIEDAIQAARGAPMPLAASGVTA